MKLNFPISVRMFLYIYFQYVISFNISKFFFNISTKSQTLQIYLALSTDFYIYVYFKNVVLSNLQ